MGWDKIVRTIFAAGGHRGQFGSAHVGFPRGEPVEDLIESDPALESSERGPEAEMDAMAEGQGLPVVPVDVASVAGGEPRSSTISCFWSG
jgi:hypothetical protein